MSIVRDDDERQVRVDRLIEEFRKAQSRRVAKLGAVDGDDHVVKQGDANGRVTVARQTTASASHSNG